MQEHGIASDKVAQVRGFGDQNPRPGAAPENPSNRRITVIIQYVPLTPEDIVAAGGKTQGRKGSARSRRQGRGKSPSRCRPCRSCSRKSGAETISRSARPTA